MRVHGVHVHVCTPNARDPPPRPRPPLRTDPTGPAPDRPAADSHPSPHPGRADAPTHGRAGGPRRRDADGCSRRAGPASGRAGAPSRAGASAARTARGTHGTRWASRRSQRNPFKTRQDSPARSAPRAVLTRARHARVLGPRIHQPGAVMMNMNMNPAPTRPVMRPAPASDVSGTCRGSVDRTGPAHHRRITGRVTTSADTSDTSKRPTPRNPGNPARSAPISRRQPPRCPARETIRGAVRRSDSRTDPAPPKETRGGAKSRERAVQRLRTPLSAPWPTPRRARGCRIRARRPVRR